ncbi:MAG: hypothetical protein ACREO3_05820 [Arenimonas sp.]
MNRAVTTASRRPTIIGHPLQETPGVPDERRFTYVGRVETKWQALFFAGVGAALLATPLPSFIGWSNVGLGAFLLLGGMANCLYAIDLRLDPARGRWRITRGLRFAPVRLEGPLSDFASLVVPLDPYWPKGGRWIVVLYPSGSFRGYGLLQRSDPDEALRACADLGRRCGIPVEPEPPWRESERLRDERLQRIRDRAQLSDPPHAPCLRQLGDGFQIEDRELYVRHVLRVDSTGVGHTMFLARSPATAPDMAWKAITQIGLEPKYRNSWVLRPDWRLRMQEWWTARCHELKRAPGPVPRSAMLLAFYDDTLRMPQRELVIRRYGNPIRFGDVRRLGEDFMTWLEVALIREWGRHGGRNPI